MDLALKTYSVSRSFPKEEIYGLTAQMRRCAVSIPSNIAEGFKRFHHKEYKQFLHITLGSAAELETQTLIAYELGYMDKPAFSYFSENLESLGKMISSLLKKLV